MKLKQFAVAAGSAVVGNLLAEKYVLRENDSQTGLVTVSPMTFGMDDVARGLVIAATMWAAGKFLLKRSA